jgi:hypothetical protein
MGDATDSFVELVKRYPWALIQIAVCLLILFTMLLVFEDIPPSWHDHIASLTIYTIGVALLTQIRLEITVYANTKAKSENRLPQGISKRAFTSIIILYALWFVLLVAYNIYRGILSFT